MSLPENISDVAMSVIFISAFICIFYFLYAVKIEAEILHNQIDYVVKDLSDSMAILPKSYRTSLATKIKNFKKPNTEKADKKVADANKKIFDQVVLMVVIGFVIMFVIIFILSRMYKFDLLPLIKKNLVIVSAIGFTEYLFLEIFARNFISADPNFVKFTVLDKLDNMIKNQHSNQHSNQYTNTSQISEKINSKIFDRNSDIVQSIDDESVKTFLSDNLQLISSGSTKTGIEDSSVKKIINKVSEFGILGNSVSENKKYLQAVKIAYDNATSSDLYKKNQDNENIIVGNSDEFGVENYAPLA